MSERSPRSVERSSSSTRSRSREESAVRLTVIDRSLSPAKLLAYSALIAAVSFVLASVYPIPFPPAEYLLYEPGDVPIIVAAVLLGPIPAVMITVVVSALMAVITGQGGIIGFIMHSLVTGCLVLVIGLLYRKGSSLPRYAIVCAGAVVLATAVAIGGNVILTPIYTGLPRSVIVDMIVPVLIPFNVMKLGVNTILAGALLRALRLRDA